MNRGKLLFSGLALGILLTISILACSSTPAAAPAAAPGSATARPAASAAQPAPAQPPQWYTELEKAYPSDKYVAYVGSGKELNEARDDGMAQIARFFGVKVEVMSEASKLYAETAGKASLEAKLSETVRVRTKQDLFAVRYSDPFRTNGKYFAAAYIERAEVAANLADSARAFGKQASNYLAAAAAADSAAGRLAKTFTARFLAGRAEPFLAKLKLLDPNQARIVAADLPSDKALDAWDEARGKARFAVSVEGDQNDRQASKVRSLITGEGFTVDARGSLAVKGGMSFVDANLSPPLKTIEWTFNLALLDEKKRELVAASKTGRSSGTSRDSALIQANMQFESFAANEFMVRFREFLASQAEP